MIKLPAREDGRWIVQYENEKLPDLVRTKNLTFDREGYIKLSKPSIALYNSDDDADVGLPVKFARYVNNQYMVVTDDRCFFINLDAGQFYIAKDTSTGAPQGESVTTHADVFNDTLVVSVNDDVHHWDFDFGWTDQGITLNNIAIHPLVNFVSQNNLAVVDEKNTLERYDTSWSAGTKLTIPANHRICCIAYNRNFLGIGTYDGRFQGQGYFYIWDGTATTANNSFPINTNGAFTVIPYGDTFHILTGKSQILQWTGSGLEELVAFPSYYDTGVNATSYTEGESHANGYYVDGDTYILNKDGGLQEPDSMDRLYTIGESAGLYCFDPKVGLYHRYGTTSTTAQREFLNEGSVNTTTDQITVASAPDTGTPVYYSSGGDTEIGGLSNGTLYYTIKIDSTHVQLAETYADAIAGTEIVLTSDITDPVVATTDVTVATDRINIASGLVGGYGKPVVYHANGGTEITGLSDGETYYLTGDNNLDAVQLASTVANALEASQIDLTGTGNDNQTFSINAHTLLFIPKSDFGQQFSRLKQGSVDVYDRVATLFGEGRSIGSGYFWGAEVASTTTTENKAIGVTLRGTENRGHFVTAKFQSQGLQDEWQKIFIKHNKLEGEFDEIHVKYRFREEDLVKVGFEGDGTTIGGAITWTDSDTFTTTDTQYANVIAGDEVEVVQGAGSGYLLHIDSITEDGGTYTVNLTEGVKNISTSDTARAIVSRWHYLTTIDNDTISNEDGYTEVKIGKRSKQIQFKIELRGEDIEIEEILVANSPIKQAI